MCEGVWVSVFVGECVCGCVLLCVWGVCVCCVLCVCSVCDMCV